MTQILLRGGTAAAWTSANPVLAAREPGVESDTRKSKMGDGTTSWNSLPYTGSTPGTYRVDDYPGADHNAQIAAALAAMGNSPGILEFGAHQYWFSNTIVLDRPGQGMRGQGVGLTELWWEGDGTAIRQWDSTVPTDGSASPGLAGPITGFALQGWGNTNANICGLHVGDLGHVFIQDVLVGGFATAGSKGFWGQNLYSWSERAYILMEAIGCTDHFRFEKGPAHAKESTSWSYSILNLAVDVYADQNGLVVINDCVLWGVDLQVFGNFNGGTSSNSGVAITIGSGTGDTSVISGHLMFFAESIGAGTVGHKDINIGPDGRLRCGGVIEFTEFAAAYVAGTATPATAEFAGRCICPSIGGRYSGNGGESSAESFRVVGKMDARTRVMTFSATPTFDLGAYDTFQMPLTGAITSATFSNGINGREYTFVFLPNGAYALNFGAATRLIGVTIPNTVSGKYRYLTGRWNTTDAKMHWIDVDQEA